MSRRFISTLCAVVTAITAAFANDLDDKFGLICAIDGVNVMDVPDEECRKEGMESGKLAMLLTPEQTKSAKAIISGLDSENLFVNEHKDGTDIDGWLICDSDDKATMLVSIFTPDANLLILCKGPKSMIDTVQINTD